MLCVKIREQVNVIPLRRIIKFRQKAIGLPMGHLRSNLYDEISHGILLRLHYEQFPHGFVPEIGFGQVYRELGCLHVLLLSIGEMVSWRFQSSQSERAFKERFVSVRAERANKIHREHQAINDYQMTILWQPNRK
jgi:hypothetical protein